MVVLLEARLLTPGSLTVCHPAVPASPGVQCLAPTVGGCSGQGTEEERSGPAGNEPRGTRMQRVRFRKLLEQLRCQ